MSHVVRLPTWFVARTAAWVVPAGLAGLAAWVRRPLSCGDVLAVSLSFLVVRLLVGVPIALLVRPRVSALHAAPVAPHDVITMVHGAGVPDASWMRRPPQLPSVLLHQAGLTRAVYALEWTGVNAHVGRLRAAWRLRDHVLEVAGRWPDARQFLVAHGHGGNVALYALNDARAAAAVEGVVTLSTPFIQARARDGGPAAEFVRVAPPFLLGSGLALLMLQWALPWVPPWALPATTHSVVHWIMNPAVDGRVDPRGWVPLLAAAAGGSVLLVAWDAWMTRLVATLVPGHFPADRLLVLRTPHDETDRARRAMAAGAAALRRVHCAVTALYARGVGAHRAVGESASRVLAMPRRFRLVTAGCVVLGLRVAADMRAGLQAGGQLGVARFSMPVLVAAAGVALYAAPLLWAVARLALVCLAAMPVTLLHALATALALPYGPDVVPAALLMELTVVKAPHGASSVRVVAPTTGRPRLPRRLGRLLQRPLQRLLQEQPGTRARRARGPARPDPTTWDAVGWWIDGRRRSGGVGCVASGPRAASRANSSVPRERPKP